MRALLRLYADVMDRASVFVGHACAVLYFACIAISALEVVMRYVFDTPTRWSFEVVMALCATAWVLTSGFVTERRRHISITVLEFLVPPAVWRLFRLFQLLIAVFAVGALAWAVHEPALTAVASVERSGSAFNTALPAYLKALLLAGSILYLLQLFANIIRWFDEAAGQGSA